MGGAIGVSWEVSESYVCKSLIRGFYPVILSFILADADIPPASAKRASALSLANLSSRF